MALLNGSWRARPWPLLVGHDVISGLSQRFQSGGTELTVWHVVGLLALLLIGTSVWWVLVHVGAHREGHSYFSARRLFGELCAQHGLDWPSRRVLRHLARAHKLVHPAQVFVEPSWFEPAQIPAELESFAPQLTELRRRLFSTTVGADPPCQRT
jgi:hypothetical protein